MYIHRNGYPFGTAKLIIYLFYAKHFALFFGGGYLSPNIANAETQLAVIGKFCYLCDGF